MNGKKIGISFLALVIIHYIVVVGLTVYYVVRPGAKEISITANLILSQLMNLVPVLLVVLIGRGKHSQDKLFGDVLGFRKIKGSTALMTVLYTFLIMPLSTLVNAISMIFVDNTVAGLAGDILDVPFFVMFPLMAVIGPLSEEIIFRGAFYRGFRKSGNLFGAVMLSALLFGLMHMNFNQAGYAIVLGIMMALVAEAAGSTTASLIVHFVFNAQSVCLMYLENAFFPELLEEELENYSFTGEEMWLTISVYLFLAVLCTAISFCVLTWIAGNEGKQNFLRTVWASRKVHREKLWSAGLIIGTILAVLFMIFDALVTVLLPYIMRLMMQ